jgi:hypothetical protein
MADNHAPTTTPEPVKVTADPAVAQPAQPADKVAPQTAPAPKV